MDPEEPSQSGAQSSGRGEPSGGSVAPSPRNGDEVEVDNDMDIDDLGDEEEEDGEDLYQEDFMERDYRASPGQDRFEAEGIDDGFQDERDMAEVLASQYAVNLELEERDRNASRIRKLPSILLNEGDTSEESRPRSRPRTTRSGSTSEQEDGPEDWRTEDEDDAEEGEEELLYNSQGNLREWISREDVRRLIAKKYRRFLHSFKSDNEGHKGYYVKLVEDMLAGLNTDILWSFPQVQFIVSF